MQKVAEISVDSPHENSVESAPFHHPKSMNYQHHKS
jgi:hypothetical protein